MISLIAYITRFNKLDSANNEASSRTEESDIVYQAINVYSEYLLISYVSYYLWITFQRLVPSLEVRVFFRSLAQAPEMSMFSFTCLLILSCIPLRLLGWSQIEDFIAALVMFTIPLKLLFFCRASRSVGSFVVMIYTILVNDVLCFVVFLIIFVAGFSQCKSRNMIHLIRIDPLLTSSICSLPHHVQDTPPLSEQYQWNRY